MAHLNSNKKPLLGTLIDWTEPLANGLVGDWPMNEGGGTNIQDMAGGQHQGRFIGLGVTWAPHQYDQVIDFAGSDADLVQIDDDKGEFRFADADGDLPFSLVTRVRSRAWDGTSNLNAIASRDDPGNDRGWLLYTASSGLLSFACFEADNAFGIGRRFGTALTIGRWYHIVVTYDGSLSRSGMKIYLNGVRADDTDIASASYSGMGAATTTRVIFGDWGQADDRNWNGPMEHFKIYNRVLNEKEAMGLYDNSYTMYYDYELSLLSEAEVGGIIPLIQYYRQSS